MAFLNHARNIVDATYSATFALPASASASTNQATPFDLTAEAFKNESVEVEIDVPALNATMAPDTRTATYIIEASAVSNFASGVQTLQSQQFAGASGAGIATQALRCRLPANCPRYVRGKVTFGASTADASTLSATVRLLF